MLKRLLSPAPLSSTGLIIIRVITGMMMAYHGLEIFDRPTMEGYLTWEIIKSLPGSEFMVYFGKSVELTSGICFILGFLTRPAALGMAGNMLFITFVVGGGKFYYQDQHPFLFAVIAMIFFFTGPVGWSLDHRLFKQKTAPTLKSH